MAKVVSNSGKKTLILHIGPEKTGSTTLQQYIFPNLEDVDYPDDFRKNVFLQCSTSGFFNTDV